MDMSLDEIIKAKMSGGRRFDGAVRSDGKGGRPVRRRRAARRPNGFNSYPKVRNA